MNHEIGAAVAEAICHGLESDEKTREPLNALIVWTELGKGLAGTLDRKGASLGLLRSIIHDHCGRPAAADIDLAHWIPLVPPERRMSRDELMKAMRRIDEAIERAIAPLLHRSEGPCEPSGPPRPAEPDRGPPRADGDRGREIFVTVVTGWFPVGLRILATLPNAAGVDEDQLAGLLGAWCDRYLPDDPAGPSDLGVRVEKR